MSFESIDMGDDRAPEGRRCLLIYGFSEKEMELVDSCNKSFGINDIIYITESFLDSDIKDLLANNNVIEKDKQLSSQIKCIVFNAFSNKDIHDYINMFGDKIFLNPIFAVVTPNSLKWKFKDLLLQLCEERSVMNGR